LLSMARTVHMTISPPYFFHNVLSARVTPPGPQGTGIVPGDTVFQVWAKATGSTLAAQAQNQPSIQRTRTASTSRTNKHIYINFQLNVLSSALAQILRVQKQEKNRRKAKRLLPISTASSLPSPSDSLSGSCDTTKGPVS
jgi:hypothetical protein